MRYGLTKESDVTAGSSRMMPRIRLFAWTFFLILCGACPVLTGQQAKAEERELTVYDGDEAYGNEDENVTEIEHFFIGDTGKIVPYSYSWLEEDEEENTEDGGTVWTYTSSDTGVVTVDGSGSYRVVGGGYAYVTVSGKSPEGYERFNGQYEFYCCADVSPAVLTKSELVTYVIDYEAKELRVPFKNMPDLKYYTYSCISSGTSTNVQCEFDREKKELVLYSSWPGTTTLTITINNKTFSLKVKTVSVSINKISAVLAKGKKTTVKLKGYPGKVTWKSTKKKTVSVSSKGIVKGKKNGNAVVYAELDGCRLGCAVSVVTAKRKKVINAAKKIAKGTYSQEKRMSKGYYDCSSLVWRAYQKEGKTFGSSNYAPVAADLCKWCFQHKKRIKGGLNEKNIQNMKLRPGDLLFETGADNGRYKGVYHVEMFVGYQCQGFDSKGKPYLGTLWAARGPNYYFGCPMGRP